MEFLHKPVMLAECLAGLAIRPDGVYLDGTAGGGGHSVEIAKRLHEGGLLIAIDRDPDAILTLRERLRPYGERCRVVQSNFSEMAGVVSSLGLPGVDGILLDLGVSSHQLDTPERGFSYHTEARLDMRMSRSGLSAYEVVNHWPPGELTRILYRYGEERYAASIVRRLVEQRAASPIETTLQLAELIKESVPAKVRREGGHPARKSFQAIRMAVNGEMEEIEQALDAALGILNPGGRCAVITFHSLEDRAVKHKFQAWCKGCECPPEFPVCVCGKKPRAALVTRKPQIAGAAELAENQRSRSAKLRVAEKLKEM